MTKEQLAEQYALTKFPNAHDYGGRKTWESLCPLDRFEDAENAYKSGFEAAEQKWIPFNRETSKQFEQCQDKLLLFDNGQTCRYDEEHPFAIMTHFLPIPKPPKND